MKQDTDITQLIARSRAGDDAAQHTLFELVYDELRRIAKQNRLVGADGATMQPTALANEAYLSLVERFPLPPSDQPESRATFFRTVAQAMRLILRNHWRSRQSQRRGGGANPVPLRDDDPRANGVSEYDRIDFLALDAALDKLEMQHPRWAEIVMHRHFAGRTLEETAEFLGIGLTSVKTDWRMARAWLYRELEETA